MKILLINHYAGSDQLGMEYRPFYLAREWMRNGHAVTVVGASFSHTRKIQPQIARTLDVTEEDGVRFRWVRTNSYAGNGASRIANLVAFVGSLLANAGRLAREEQPDVVVCSSTYPLDIYPGERIARRCGARLVFEVHDLWPLSPMLLGGYSAKHPYIRALQAAEDKAYRDADLVISILPTACPYMVSRGMPAEKFVHIPNGVIVDNGDLPSEKQFYDLLRKIDSYQRAGHFLVCYAGSIGVAQNLSTLIHAAKIIVSTDVKIVIVGDGPESKRLQSQAAELDNVHFLGRVPKKTIRPLLSRMDAFYFSLMGQKLFKYGISPNKLFDYMLAGRPVIQAVAAGNDLVAEAGCGVTVPPDAPEEVAQAMLYVRNLPAEERRRLGENGRRYVIENHNYRILADRFVREMAAT